MKKLVYGALLWALFSPAYAAWTFDGTLYVQTNSNNTPYVTVDYYLFTVLSDTQMVIDFLSWEADDADWVTPDGIPESIDLNNDGEIAFVDGYFQLFRNDGSLDSSDWIAEFDDDDLGQGHGDGSIYDYDSYLSIFLTEGDYLLAISAYELEIDEAINKENYFATDSVLTCSPPIGSECDYLPGTHGDYRLTIRGNFKVSEPWIWLLIGTGLLGMGSRRIRMSYEQKTWEALCR